MNRIVVDVESSTFALLEQLASDCGLSLHDMVVELLRAGVGAEACSDERVVGDGTSARESGRDLTIKH